MTRLLAACLLIVAAGCCLPVWAQSGAAGAAGWSPAKETRYQALLTELRCMVCQNENLKASQADLAADMRRQVHAMVVRGDSNQQIKQYLVNRYGQYILYRPRFEMRTWALWLGPFVLLGIGLLVIVITLRRSRRKASARAPDANALARARRYLEDGGE